LEKPVYRKQRHSSYLENNLEERAVQLARYMVENNATVRQTATVFGVSKSTVHKDGCGIIVPASLKYVIHYFSAIHIEKL